MNLISYSFLKKLKQEAVDVTEVVYARMTMQNANQRKKALAIHQKISKWIYYICFYFKNKIIYTLNNF